MASGDARVNQLVAWLCDPFGDSDVSDHSHAVMSTMPSLKSLKTGDEVIGVVVGVMPFGVFVELAPDCSGLIHVSKVSESFVEDLHEAIQVGDVVTAWVTSVDEKRKRVALSTVSPQREANSINCETNEPVDHREVVERRVVVATKQEAEAEENRPARSETLERRRQGTAKPAGSATSRGGQPSRAGQGNAGAGKSGNNRGRRDSRGGQGGRGRDSRGPRKPESYRVVSKPEAKPITEAMQIGAEPLRSFGDLLQFFGKDKQDARGEAGELPSSSNTHRGDRTRSRRVAATG